MSDLVAFLRARLDEDEQAARAAAAANGSLWIAASGLVVGEVRADSPHLDGALWDNEGAESLCMIPATSAHIARWDPARVLAEVAAKRAILDLHEGAHECSVHDHHGEIDNCHWVLDDEDCTTVRLLAQPYAGNPGWRDEWRIEEWSP